MVESARPGVLTLLGYSSALEAGGLARTLDRRLTIGRASECDLVLDDGASSRVHAELMPSGAGAEVVDRGSRNGTFVDGRRVTRAPLSEGSLLRVGDTLFRLVRLTEAFSPARAEGPLVGGTSIAAVNRLISLVGPTDLSVLVLGETGTGKEVVARLLHNASGRSGPFIAVNCAALPESLVESELFGHVRGAFTDARTARKGLFSAATGGTLFLDEVGDIPQGAQAKLLRVLEDGLVRPVGSETAHKVDVRVLAATNRDLQQAVADRAFRPDLLARLSGVELRLPSLRSRTEDLPALASFLQRRNGRPGVPLSADALEAMALYEWPQNVRELDNVLRGAALSARDELALGHLPERIQEVLHRARATQAAAEEAPPPRAPVDIRAEIEEALRIHRGNVRRVSQALGIARGHLYRLLERWNLDPNEFRLGGQLGGPAIAKSERA